MKSTKNTLKIARTFGRVTPVEGKPGHYRLEAPWKEISAFLRKMDRLDRGDYRGAWECNGEESWAIINPWS